MRLFRRLLLAGRLAVSMTTHAQAQQSMMVFSDMYSTGIEKF
jgi:hypothetical protein